MHVHTINTSYDTEIDEPPLTEYLHHQQVQFRKSVQLQPRRHNYVMTIHKA